MKRLHILALVLALVVPFAIYTGCDSQTPGAAQRATPSSDSGTKPAQWKVSRGYRFGPDGNASLVPGFLMASTQRVAGSGSELSVRCMKGVTEWGVFVSLPGYAKHEEDPDPEKDDATKATVYYSLDGAPAEKVNADGNTMVYRIGGRPLANKLVAHRALSIKYTELLSGELRTATFDLRDVGQAMNYLRPRCGLSGKN